MGRVAATECLGTGLLLTIIVGSGIMGERLSAGNVAIALLANSIATGCGLFVLILIFAPVSGAHLNPLVSALARNEGAITTPDLLLRVLAQCAGALLGVALAHAMFGLTWWQPSAHERTGAAQWLAEGVATFGLPLAIIGARRFGMTTLAAAVATYICAAYWFTASTSFANPAVTIARALTPTFAGVAPSGIVPFVVAQLCGAALAVAASRVMYEAA